MQAPAFKDKFFTALLRILPQHLLSGIMYRVTRVSWKPLKNMLIREVISRYAVDMFEAQYASPEHYASFNAFFTRSLKDGARPIATQADAVVSPCDGKVSQAGTIRKDRLIQAKGHNFRLRSLLGDNSDMSSLFMNGVYSTIYLSPRDYHRIHMPVNGILRSMTFVPGTLFSVSEATAQLVPDLFARNERLICRFDTAAGPMCVILVGAIFVGSMETVWAGEIRPRGKKIRHWNYGKKEGIRLHKGQELGRFNMGSTVITLFAKHRVAWDPAFKAGVRVRMGQRIGHIIAAEKKSSKLHPSWQR